jgi:hypothetical protein
MQGPTGTHPVTATLTQNFLNLTNAVEAYSVDFVDDQTSEIRAEVFALKTLDGPYSHDYSVCDRFHDFILDSISFHAYPDLDPGSPWFLHCTMHQDTIVEKALLFTILVDEDASPTQFLVDSRWLDDYYYPDPIYPPYDYMLNFQIWSRSSEDEAADLMRCTIDNLRNHGTVSFFNTTEPMSPTVFIKTASYSDDTIHLTVQSSLAESRTVHFFGSMRPYTDTNTSLPFSFYETVQPGENLVELPVENMIDAIVLSKIDDFLDKVYVGGGFWFHFSDDESEAFPVPMTCDSPTSFGGQDFALAGCYHITGAVALQHGYVGMGRVFNPNGQPVDVSGYQALTFWAKGDGKSYRVNIETDSVDDYDYPQFVFTPPDGEWRQSVIPLSLFKQQGWGKPVPFTATDVKSVAWLSMGPHCDDAVELAIDQVAFSNSTLINGTSGPTSTNDVSGPYTITTEINDDIGVVTATLYYSVNEGDFVGIAMTGDGSTFNGEIPGQPMEAKVRYYIEATDADGNVATDPVDAPYTTYRFRVEQHPSLLVDDFGDRNPYNVLGGWSGIFKDPDEGGVITPCYDGHVLCLTFDVTDHLPGVDEYAGYYSELEQADLSSYNSIVFRVKGASGGEQVRIGLNDGAGHEPKIEISEYLPRGITTNWQTVGIPLIAFTSVTDWSAMESFTLAAEESINSGSGTIYFDDLNFEPDGWIIQLDNFNDLDNQNGLGQRHDTDDGGGASIVPEYDQVNPCGGKGASLALTYNVPGDAHAAWHSGLGGLNASSYDTLSFAVRGISGEESFHVWLVDQEEHSGWVDVTNYTTVTNTWPSAPVEIPLQDFDEQGVDLTQLSLFKIAFEWVPMNGTVYLDDIRFTGEGMLAPDLSGIYLPIILKDYPPE